MFSSISTNPFGKSSMAAPFCSQFGVSSSPGFGTSACGTSTRAFGSSSSFGGGPSEFGKKASFGGLRSTPCQTSPLGSTFPQTQPKFGTSAFGSTPLFRASIQPAIGSSSTSAFGTTNTPVSGATASSAFGVTPNSTFGPTNSPAFGATMTSFTFGTSSAPAFGTTVVPAFGVQSTFAPLSSSFPAFSATSTPSFRSPTPFLSPSSPSFSFGTVPSFSQSTSTSGCMPFETTSSPFGTQSSKFGTQTMTSAFCSPGFRQSYFVGQQQQKQQEGGSRVAKYGPTLKHEENCDKKVYVKMQSISAMPIYKDKNHEELRWEDYQLGDKGLSLSSTPTTGSKSSFLTNSDPSNFPRSNLGPNPSFSPTFQAATPMQPPNAFTYINFTQTQPVCQRTTPAQTSNPFSLSIHSQTQPGFQPAFSTQTSNIFPIPTQTSSAFNLSQTQPASSTGLPTVPAQTLNFFSVPTQTSSAFNLNQAQPDSWKGLLIGPAQTSSPFSVPTQTSSTFNLNQTLPASSNSLIAVPVQTSSIFSIPTQTTSSFHTCQTQPASSNVLITVPAQTSIIFSVPTETQSTFSLRQIQPASLTCLPTVPAQTSSIFSLPTQTSSAFNLTQAQLASSNGLITDPVQTSSIFSVPTQAPSALNLTQIQPASSTCLPTVTAQTSSIFPVPTLTSSSFNLNQAQPASSTGLEGTSGISGQGNVGQPSSYQSNAVMKRVPISNPFGTLPSLHHLSLGPVQYGISSMPVALKSAPTRTSPLSAPRHLSQRRINLPVRKYNPKIDGLKVPFFTDNEERKAPSVVDKLFIPRENPRSLVTGSLKQWPPKASPDEQPTGKDVDNPTNENANPHPPSPSKSAAKVYEHGDDAKALMPKLRHADYYTEPQIQELAAKERARPGFCRHVKDFVVGRHGYGCIKFYGETDVRRIDIESIIQFNDREVIVYEDGSKKPPIGQGLNKAAEVTLLNVKCIKKGQHYTEGRMVEKYKDMLMKKAEQQGAEFMSFDAVKGLWKFRVQHF